MLEIPSYSRNIGSIYTRPLIYQPMPSRWRNALQHLLERRSKYLKVAVSFPAAVHLIFLSHWLRFYEVVLFFILIRDRLFVFGDEFFLQLHRRRGVVAELHRKLSLPLRRCP